MRHGNENLLCLAVVLLEACCGTDQEMLPDSEPRFCMQSPVGPLPANVPGYSATNSITIPDGTAIP